jgi:hypothetical protein
MSTTDSRPDHDSSTLLGLGSSDVLGPLPDTTLAEIRNDAINQARLSETGTAYWGSNWREVRKLYTAAEMHAYAAQERAAERERMIADGWRQTRYTAPVTDCEACLTPDACAIRGHYLRERG